MGGRVVGVPMGGGNKTKSRVKFKVEESLKGTGGFVVRRRC